MYPAGVTQAHTSDRLRTLAAWLYLVGMSYGTAAEVLDAWRVYLCKSRIHDIVQSVLMVHPGLERRTILSDVRFAGARMQTVLAQYGSNTLSLELVTSEDDAWVELQSPNMAPQQVSSMMESLEALATPLGLHVITSQNRLLA
jgi:hypothetical protein